MEKRKALCLDFDGTIRRNKDSKTSHINNPDEIELMPGIEEIIWKYRDNGFLIFGVSNQAGVAHGFKTAEGCDAEMQRTFDLFDRNPFHLAKWCYFDPKGRVEPFNVRSLCRKPGIGMLAQLEEEALENGYVVDWDNSLFVGDRPEDEGCAMAAGITFKHIDLFLNMKHLDDKTGE